MKSMKNVLAFTAVFFLAVSSIFAAKSASVKTEVDSFDKHGNINLKITGNLFSANDFGLGDLVSVKVGSFKFDAAIGKNYTDVDNGDYLVRVNEQEVSLAINMGNLEQKSGAKIGDTVVITMKEKLGYLRTYQSRLLKKSERRADYDMDEVFANWRPVKVGKIAENRLYRSVNPIGGDSRAPYAADLLSKTGVQTIVNLADTESSGAGKMSMLPFYSNLATKGNVVFLNMGAAYKDKVFAKKLNAALHFMANHPGPYLVHGKEGRIRTGFVCAVLEALSGATIEEMNNDYMLSYENLYGLKKTSTQYFAISKSVSQMFIDISGGKKVTDSNVQSLAELYLTKTVGLSSEDIAKLKKNLQE
ncbi:MAG: SAM-dependent chlorinase/fluorinase [Treponema sp.]|nr:SAM-dependent chlorinase/fluorinase [Treponema sp.]